MTDLDKRIDEIMELDKARTQGKWHAEWYKTYTGVVRDEFTKIAELPLPPEVDGFSLEEYKEKARTNAAFIAKAPEMVSIIRELQAQVVERDRVIAELADLVQCLIDNDPNDSAADAVSVLDVWRHDATRTLQKLATINKAGE